MTLSDFSNQFDTLANSYADTQVFGTGHFGPLVFDEYEKSVFLTLAQENVVKSCYTSDTELNFEQTEEARRSLDALVRTWTFNYGEQPFEEKGVTGLPENFQPYELIQGKVHTTFLIPQSIWYIVYEEAQFSEDSGECTDGNAALVVPTTHDTFYRTVRNPFRGPNGNRVLRLNAGHWMKDNSNIENYEKIELVANSPIQKYRIRYIKRPSPIILKDLPGRLNINGKQKAMNCELHDSLHSIILANAVTLAVNSRKEGQADTKKKSS